MKTQSATRRVVVRMKKVWFPEIFSHVMNTIYKGREGIFLRGNTISL